MKVALFYPHTNLLSRASGSSLRVHALLAYLSQQCEEVCVVSRAKRSGRTSFGNIQHLFFTLPLWQKIKGRSQRIFWLVWKGSRFALERATLRAFTELQCSRSFLALSETVIRRSQVVFLEYPFWALAVIPLCKQHGVPCVLTAHDVLSHGVVCHPPTANRILELELAALRDADYAFCVSESDQHFFESWGLTVGCVANPIDIEQCRPVDSLEQVEQFRRQAQLGDAPIALFVGSAHIPNFEAVKIIEQIAQQVPNYTFVIVGSCSSPERVGNVIKLGVIDSETLHVIYTLAAVILIPLKSGTGASLKFIEALAYGRTVLSSSVAARGYPVTPGKQAIVCDDFSRYPALLNDLIAYPEKSLNLAQQAKIFAQTYDYRRVFQPYGELLNQLRQSTSHLESR